MRWGIRSKHGQRSRANYTPPYDSLPLSQETLNQLGNTYQPKEIKNMTDSDFEYTDKLEDIDSSVIVDAYYSATDRKFLAILENENAYLYSGIPSWMWDSFKKASSKGSYYSTTIKRNYGPAENLGWADGVEITPVSKASVTPIRPNYSLGTVGTPKGLNYASDAQVTTKAEVFPLSTAAPAAGVTKATTTVLFEAADGDRTVKFDDKSTVDEALSEFNRLANMLGITAKVVAVTVHFE